MSELRDMRKGTMKDECKKIGISYTTLSNAENGKIILKSTANAIQKYYNLSDSYVKDNLTVKLKTEYLSKKRKPIPNPDAKMSEYKGHMYDMEMVKALLYLLTNPREFQSRVGNRTNTGKIKEDK